MPVEVRLFGPFRDDVGEAELTREADTVGELLRDLEADYPVLSGRLVDEAGDEDGIAGQTVVTVAKTNVRHREGVDTDLDDGDVVRLTPSVYGG